jgi:predicted ATPase
MFLDAIQLRFDPVEASAFPFNLPLWRQLEALALTTPVTFFVGDNGAGKSTLLEAIATAFQVPALTQADADRHPLMGPARELSKQLRFVRRAVPGQRRRHGFFFRADDVTGFIQRLGATRREHEELEQHFDESLSGYGQTLATGATRAQVEALKARYGEDPFACSHGELFLTLLKERITAPGLYLMDEPETPLSPVNQIALLALLRDAAERGSQFIIATHSPILMALPGARLLDFDQHPPVEVAWEDVEHVSLTRAFLNNPESFLRHL